MAVEIVTELREYELPDLGPHTAKCLRSLLDRAADEIEQQRSLLGKASVSAGFSRQRVKPLPIVAPPWDTDEPKGG